MLYCKFLGNILRICAVLIFGAAIASYAAEMQNNSGKFYFVQFSDTHWGFNDPKINPDFSNTLQKAIAEVNDLEIQPDFIVFTGDLTHTTDDPQIRRQRMMEFKTIISGFKVTNIMFLPGNTTPALTTDKPIRKSLAIHIMHLIIRVFILLHLIMFPILLQI